MRGKMQSYGSKSEKRSLLSGALIMGLVILVLGFALYLLLFGHSFGWFASNDTVEAEGMQIAARSEGYDLLVERPVTPEYDKTITAAGVTTDKYEGIGLFKQALEDSPYGYDFVVPSTAEAPKLAFELHNELVFQDDGVDWYFLMPGAYGSMTFYIRPHDVSTRIAFDMELELGAFGTAYVGNTLTLDEVDSPTVLELLRGHVMFFTGRTGNNYADYKYTGLLSDGGILSFDSANVPAADIVTIDGETCYRITLYWEWPLTYYDIDENIGTQANPSRFPPEVRTFINNEPECFFAANIGSTDPDDLSDGYNDGDQMIGEQASFFAAFISPVVG